MSYVLAKAKLIDAYENEPKLSFSVYRKTLNNKPYWDYSLEELSDYGFTIVSQFEKNGQLWFILEEID